MGTISGRHLAERPVVLDQMNDATPTPRWLLATIPCVMGTLFAAWHGIAFLAA